MLVEQWNDSGGNNTSNICRIIISFTLLSQSYIKLSYYKSDGEHRYYNINLFNLMSYTYFNLFLHNIVYTNISDSSLSLVII